MSPRVIIGAMSGTSADGIDVAVTQVVGDARRLSARLLHLSSHPYHASLRNTIHTIRSEGAVALSRLAACGRAISLAYCEAICGAAEAANLTPDQVTAVAVHGQTLFHDPPNTIQWIDPALVAARTGCSVISDFRRADCAAGGQGAPLVPFADFHLFASDDVHRVIVNIGGIANVTLLPRASSIDAVRAFDTGPGNCISDAIVRRADLNSRGIDTDGSLAAAGQANDALVAAMLADPYFHRPGPKSTDGPQMVGIFDAALTALDEPIGTNDQLASVCFVAAELIARAVPRDEDCEVLVAGGGVKNRTLMQMLRDALGADMTLRTTDDVGIPSAAREAMAFAILGAATLDGVCAGLPACTGAAHPTILGSITPRQKS
jgi:anhydro-N-acetylmuramic acid kinase